MEIESQVWVTQDVDSVAVLYSYVNALGSLPLSNLPDSIFLLKLNFVNGKGHHWQCFDTGGCEFIKANWFACPNNC